jgi:phosphoribosylformylglycinamidine cyclo-ligase
VIDGKQVAMGDTLLALPSAGLHTNGYSLARKLFFEVAGYEVDTHLTELNATVGAALLEPHRSYLSALDGLLDTGRIKALAHITGGGLLENIPRVLPAGTSVAIARGAWPVPAIFTLMQQLGHIPDSEMYRTFNMGVGLVIICAAQDAEAIQSHFARRDEPCYEIGRVIEGNREVLIA